MKHILFIISLVGAFTFFSSSAQTSDIGESSQTETSQATRMYPIAPGVWYPGSGELPEKPVRYYRVRCWPGCHHGSSHGKHPNIPLNMDPIFPTSTIDLVPKTGNTTK
jgi:hypothetical protein